MEREKIDRINELARRKKSGEALTEEERARRMKIIEKMMPMTPSG